MPPISTAMTTVACPLRGRPRLRRMTGPTARLGRWLCLAGLAMHFLHGPCRGQWIDDPPRPRPRAVGGGGDYQWLIGLAGAAVMVLYCWNGRKPKRGWRPAARRRAGIGVRVAVNAQQVGPSPSGDRTLIESLCQRTGTLIVHREGDHFWVRHPGATRGERVRIGLDRASVLFNEFLGVEFPLDPEPRGLFARLMLRNFNLQYGGWFMHIGGHCGAQVGVSARIPTAALDAALFDAVCRELIAEVEGFRQELHEKFRYGIGDARADGAGGPPESGVGAIGQTGTGGAPLPVPRSGDLPEIRYLR